MSLSKITENEFTSGVRYALEYLSELYDGIEETSIWEEYFPNFCCGACGLIVSIDESESTVDNQGITEYTHRANKCDIAIEEGLN